MFSLHSWHLYCSRPASLSTWWFCWWPICWWPADSSCNNTLQEARYPWNALPEVNLFLKTHFYRLAFLWCRPFTFASSVWVYFYLFDLFHLFILLNSFIFIIISVFQSFVCNCLAVNAIISVCPILHYYVCFTSFCFVLSSNLLAVFLKKSAIKLLIMIIITEDQFASCYDTEMRSSYRWHKEKHW